MAKEQKINKTSQLQQQQQVNQNQSDREKKESFELVQYCYLITNLFVYSLYGIIAGIIIIGVLYIKYRIIWSKRMNEIGK